MKFGCILAIALCVCASADDITPRVGSVEIYGTHKVSKQKIEAAIGVKPGQPMPSRPEIQEKVAKVPGVVAAHIESFCCYQSKTILYVGIEERDRPHIEFRPAPTGDDKLPDTIVTDYNQVLDSVGASLRGQNADEDLTNGYSLLADPQGREWQQELIPLVAANLTTIDRVLRNSADPDQRAAAAYLLQYAPRSTRDGKLMADDLQYALQDEDENVRSNAMLALKAVMVGAKLHPDQNIQIQPTWFVELMNSAVWSDRRNASLALLTMTDDRDEETLDLIRERALDSVLDMARWHDPEHSLPGFYLAGRLDGLTDPQIRQAWLSGDREQILKDAAKAKRKT